MKKLNKGILLACISALTFGSIMHSDDTSSLVGMLKLEQPIRVLLQKTSLEATQWTVYSNKGFIIYNQETPLHRELHKKTLSITSKNGSLHSNNRELPKSKTYILPITGMLSINGIEYEGYFSLEHDGTNSYLINHVGLEDYITSVLPYEAIPSWPDEVLKAQCIAARTYTLARLIELKKENKSQPFDMYCTERDQVYNGKKSRCCLKRIIEATRGIIIIKDNKPIRAMYSSVCGGIVPADLSSDFCKEYPYLKRTYACNHCKDQRNYRWKTDYTFDELDIIITTIIYNMLNYFSGCRFAF